MAIAAISTPPGYGGIGIIRLSGEDSFKVVKNIFEPIDKNSKIEGYKMKFGHIFDSKGKYVDEVLVTYFISPKSFTTENMVEINSHGGPIILKKILELCLLNGARLAEPGEFTKIAFLNGRIDLAQAEAVIDMINSKTYKEQEAAMNQLDGKLSNKIKNIRRNIMNKIVDIEAMIDYPEYDIEEITREDLRKVLQETLEELQKINETFSNGKIIKEGIQMAIIGKPNAGKSSLLNAIINEERAIVTDLEGTTRDTIEEYISIEGIPIKVIDTAGIRNKTGDIIEEIGIKKAKEIAKKADLILYIIDSSKKLDEEEKEILQELQLKKCIIVLNKYDLEHEITAENIELKVFKKEIIEMSALKKEGIEELFNKISKMFNLGEITVDNSVTITNERHKEIITNAVKNIRYSIEELDKNTPVDIIQISIKQVVNELGMITGETASDEIINEIFKKFCLGK
jgi:tRNA modification GTPase